MFKPNLSVKETLDYLSTRLEPIIAERLATMLNGLPWTKILDVLDQKKGYSGSYLYSTTDLQAQLRILTERLGDAGFPFDNHDRIVSTVGSELRIVRNRSAHNHEFTTLEAFRASDFAVRLLTHLGDEEGRAELERIRLGALVELAREEGLSEEKTEEKAAQPPTRVAADSPDETSDGEEDVSPDPEVLERETDDPQEEIIGSHRLQYEPWETVLVGEVDVLNSLPKKAAKEEVRSVAVEIATYEGPIHLERLTTITARSFGLLRVTPKRRKKISYQIRQAGLFVDEHDFVWPREIDPGSWTEFRPNDGMAGRKFYHISPAEIANAARFIRRKHPEFSRRQLETEVLKTFGRRNRTSSVLTHLRKALDEEAA